MSRNSYTRRTFGLSEAEFDEEYDILFEEQSGKCKICRQPQRNDERLCFDHSHRTDQLRKLLCHRCNLVIGAVDDDQELLFRMIFYLREEDGHPQTRDEMGAARDYSAQF